MAIFIYRSYLKSKISNVKIGLLGFTKNIKDLYTINLIYRIHLNIMENNNSEVRRFYCV